ncbi:DUF2569 domain-containing protein [Sphingomicrobium astaxanthinifaciens]|uniref:DUF2569 domain-containing protein n=1 Tax=Sphingomicrobium astaxanthinifaciens TaxID=1227949 RepID=UPI001FCAA817|nr:DUF2569 domain-containing protein [Sphingomicrobium astaxanthinifaciens]MCJ7421278.1 DUF2569 domain-containing protein [Sphingomicrobium astaxanthinifaciens]
MASRVQHQLSGLIDRHRRRLAARAAAIHHGLEANLPKLVVGWMLLAMSACSLRVVASPTMGQGRGLETAAPYVLVVLAPVVTLLFALHWFRDGEAMPRDGVDLARIGHWRKVAPARARAHALYGAGGIMVSLLIGMLLNVPLRVTEFLVAIPAIPSDTPHWLSTLHFMMTLDVVVLTSLYTLAFCAALRKVPFFPLLLGTIWLLDLTMQLVVAQVVAGAGLPPGVAAPLHTLLDGNVKKVLISAALWAPYLLLSERVNITYRHRVAA